MLPSRRSTTALFALAMLAVGAPAFAQTDAPAPATSLRLATPITFAPQERNEQGLGIFVQVGYVKATAFDVGTSGSFFGQEGSVSGVLFGVGFGGNKSAKVGFGADVNYMARNGDLVFGELKTAYLNVPVFVRFNFMGHATKEAPTAYAIAGGALDFLLKADLSGNDVSDHFAGFAPGILFGAGFEMMRFAGELRFTFSVKSLKEDANGNYWMGLSDFRQASITLLFRYRLR